MKRLAVLLSLLTLPTVALAMPAPPTPDESPVLSAAVLGAAPGFLLAQAVPQAPTLDPDVVGMEPLFQLIGQGLSGHGGTGPVLTVAGLLVLLIYLARKHGARFLPFLQDKTAAVVLAFLFPAVSAVALGLSAGQPFTLALLLNGLVAGALPGLASMGIFSGGKAVVEKATAQGQAAAAKVQTPEQALSTVTPVPVPATSGAVEITPEQALARLQAHLQAGQGGDA